MLSLVEAFIGFFSRIRLLCLTPMTDPDDDDHDPSVGSAEMSRICDRTYVVHHYLDQLPSQPPKLSA